VENNTAPLLGLQLNGLVEQQSEAMRELERKDQQLSEVQEVSATGPQLSVPPPTYPIQSQEIDDLQRRLEDAQKRWAHQQDLLNGATQNVGPADPPPPQVGADLWCVCVCNATAAEREGGGEADRDCAVEFIERAKGGDRGGE
jgi:hypothetical protein